MSSVYEHKSTHLLGRNQRSQFYAGVGPLPFRRRNCSPDAVACIFNYHRNVTSHRSHRRGDPAGQAQFPDRDVDVFVICCLISVNVDVLWDFSYRECGLSKHKRSLLSKWNVEFWETGLCRVRPQHQINVSLSLSKSFNLQYLQIEI